MRTSFKKRQKEDSKKMKPIGFEKTISEFKQINSTVDSTIVVLSILLILKLLNLWL